MNTIPSDLIARDQWVTWNYVDDTKVPFNAVNGKHASSTNTKTWTSFEVAERAQKERQHAGVGFVFSKDDPYTGVDLDDCIADDGTIAAWAYDIVRSLDSYTEISPSGKGLKIWVEGVVPVSVKTAQVEIYSERRYFTVTGQHLNNTPTTIRAAQNELMALFEQFKRHRDTNDRTFSTPALDDSYLRAWADRVIDSAVARMREASNGTRHNTRLAMGRLLGGLIKHGLMTEDRAERLLYDANTPDHNHTAERQAIKDGIANGKSDPLELPSPPPQPVMDDEGFACCPDHKRRLTKGKRRGWYCAERDASTPSGWCNFWWEGEEYVEPTTTESPLQSPPIEHKVTFVTSSVDWRQQGITLRQLQTKHFDPERWIIERILPEGACLFAAKYKSRKSWIALAIGLAISMGGKALGQLEVHPGRVLYLDLEGRQQRIKKRTRAILGVQQVDWPENFHVFTKWPMGDEGIKELEYWYSSYPDTVYTVIDVLADFRRPIEKHEMGYAYDRTTVQPLNELFERYRSCGLLVHHFNKAKNDDIMDSISGTTGLPSAVNTMWGLARDPNDSNITILHLRGRDLEDDEPLALRWDSYLNMHVIEGPAREVSISSERKAIIQLLSDDEPRTPKDIAAALNRPVAAIQFLLRKLLNDGLIDKPSYGKYAVIAQSAQTPQSAQSAQSTQTERQSPTLSGRSGEHSEFAGHQNGANANSEHSEGVKGGADFSIDCAEINGAQVWRLWDDITNTVLSEHTTEAEAQAEARRRMT